MDVVIRCIFGVSVFQRRGCLATKYAQASSEATRDLLKVVSTLLDQNEFSTADTLQQRSEVRKTSWGYFAATERVTRASIKACRDYDKVW